MSRDVHFLLQLFLIFIFLWIRLFFHSTFSFRLSALTIDILHTNIQTHLLSVEHTFVAMLSHLSFALSRVINASRLYVNIVSSSSSSPVSSSRATSSLSSPTAYSEESRCAFYMVEKSTKITRSWRVLKMLFLMYFSLFASSSSRSGMLKATKRVNIRHEI